MSDSGNSQTCPEGVDHGTWQRYLQGGRAIDDLWASGARCPGNPDPNGMKCLCAVPKDKICRFWWALMDVAAKVGGATLSLMKTIS